MGGAPWKDSSYKIGDVGDGVVRYKLERKSEAVSREYRIRKKHFDSHGIGKWYGCSEFDAFCFNSY